MSAEHSAWLDEVDFLRVAALVAVVVIHTGAWIVWSTTPPAADPTAALIGLARFSVPAFVIVSGLVLYRARLARRLRPAAFLRRRLARVALPWLFWAPVFTALALLDGDLAGALGPVAERLALGAGHLYFLVLIVQLYLVLLAMPGRGRGLVAFTAAALALQVGLDAARTLLPVLPGGWGWLWTHGAHELAPFWVGYFSLGCLAGAEYDRLRAWSRHWKLALGLAAIAFAAFLASSLAVPAGSQRQATNVFLWPTLVPFALATTLGVLWAGAALRPRLARVWPAVQAVSRHSLGIYILHVVFLTAFAELTWGMPAPLRLPLLVGLVTAASYVAVAALTRTRLGAASVGESAPLVAGVRRGRAFGVAQ